MNRPEPPVPVPFPRSVSILTRKSFSKEPLQVIEGALPSELYGSAYYISPAGSLSDPLIEGTDLIQPTHDGTPLFNGDPLVYRLDMGSDSVVLSSSIPQTPCYYTDQATLADSKYSSFKFHNHGLARLSYTLGFRNEVNTAFQPMLFHADEGIRLLITWDAGRPYEIDPETLQVATPVGFNHEWQEQIELQMPFGIVTTTAHTAFDPNINRDTTPPQLYTVNYGKSISTALLPIFTNEAGYPEDREETILASFERLLTAIEIRTDLIRTPLETYFGLINQIRNNSPRRFLSLLEQPDVSLRKNLVQQFRSIKPTLKQIDRRLPDLLGIPNRPRFRETVEALLDLLEELLEKDWNQLLANLNEIRRLLAVARSLLKSAKKMDDFVHIMVWDGSNSLKKWNIVLEDEGVRRSPRIFQSMHQIAITRDYVVLMDTVFKLGTQQLLTSPAPDFPRLERVLRILLDFKQSDDTTIYIVKRIDLIPENDDVVAKKIVIPRSAAHFLADYEHPEGKLILHLAHNTGWDPAEWTRSYDVLPYSKSGRFVGMSTGGTDVNRLGKYVIDVERAKIISSNLVWHGDLTWMTAIYTNSVPDGVSPVGKYRSIYWVSWGCHGDLLPRYIADLYRDYPYREIPYDVARKQTVAGLPVSLIRLDLDSMRIADSYCFPSGYFGNSPQFVPCKTGGDDPTAGHLICVVNGSNDIGRSEFWIFDAANLSKGPVCKLAHPELAIGMTVHTTWTPTVTSRKSKYTIPVREDYAEKLEKIEGENAKLLRELFDEYVYPNFEG